MNKKLNKKYENERGRINWLEKIFTFCYILQKKCYGLANESTDRRTDKVSYRDAGCIKKIGVLIKKCIAGEVKNGNKCP